MTELRLKLMKWLGSEIAGKLEYYSAEVLVLRNNGKNKEKCGYFILGKLRLSILFLNWLFFWKVHFEIYI